MKALFGLCHAHGARATPWQPAAHLNFVPRTLRTMHACAQMLHGTGNYGPCVCHDESCIALLMGPHARQVAVVIWSPG